MELKGRLRLITEKVSICDTVCDIGTDHAYIPIYLVQKGICRKAIACDVKKGPLDAAVENISRFGLQEKIETRLGNGLEPIGIGEVESIIIAGMGGNLIAEILQKGLNQAMRAKQLILQPMNDIEITRKWLYENRFHIYDEELAEEGSKIYNVICAKWSDKEIVLPIDIYYYIGERLVGNKDPLLKKLITRKLMQLEKAMKELKNANETSKGIFESYDNIYKELNKLMERI